MPVIRSSQESASRSARVPHIDVPAAISWEVVGPAAQASMPFGASMARKGNHLLIWRGNARIRIELKRRKKGTRVTVALVYPWWTWMFLLLGLVAIIIAQVVYDAMAGDLQKEVHARLSQALLGGYMPQAPPGAFAPSAMHRPGPTAPSQDPTASRPSRNAPRPGRNAPRSGPPLAFSPGNPVPCPFCKAAVVPTVDAQGRKLCPRCRNTGRIVVAA